MKVKFKKTHPDGDRVAQLKIGLTPKIDFVEVEKLNEKERGLNGIGSTGRK